jgi:hypothetical protein
LVATTGLVLTAGITALMAIFLPLVLGGGIMTLMVDALLVRIVVVIIVSLLSFSCKTKVAVC